MTIIHYVFLGIGAAALAASMLPIALAGAFVKRIRLALEKPPGDYTPKVAMIVPCKGLDPDFQVNIQSLFDQAYPSFQLVFVTALADDPAYPELERLIRANPGARARLETAGLTSFRSQKVNNQLKAVSVLDSNTDVLVFLDSDIRPEPDFLRHLVQPLENPSVGLATGFRWYLPVQGGLWSVLRSAWNGGGVVFLTDPAANYAWGGAMAIRRETFQACGAAKVWETALSDDMTLTRAVREHGLKIQFVPQCLVATHEDCTCGQMLEWTNRQTVISRVYHKGLWRKIALAHGLGNAILVLGAALTVALCLGWYTHPVLWVAAALMLAMIPMEMIGGLFLLPAVERMLPRHRATLRRLIWRYFLLAPAASWLACVNTLYSLFTNRITWRGVTYEMHPFSVKVVEP